MTTSNEHNNAPAVAQGLERYEPTVMVEESRGRLTATGAVMKPKEDGRWVRLRDLTATPAPAPADGRGTDAQIQKERDIARHAIVGALAAGYAGQAHPGADHWLAAAHDAGVRIKSLEAPAPAVPSGRTELEIVEQTEELAAYLMHWRFGQEPESPSVKFRDTENVKAQKCRAAARRIQEMITATDVENAVAEVDDAQAPAPAQEIDKSVADAEIKAMYVESQGSEKGWLGIEGSYFIGGVVAARKQKAAPAPAQYKDSTPQLSVGESSFESWFESYNPANKGDKQRSRDAYAAGMGDPLVAAAPAQGEPFGYFRAEPFGWTDCAEDDEGAIALYERPQEAGLTDEEIEAIAKKHMSTVGDHWCNEEAIRERHAEDFARAIIAALRAKGGKHV